MKAPIQKGFTLIELMIVVAIIGILAALAIPAYQDNTARAQMTEAFSLISGLKPAVAETIATAGNHNLGATNSTYGIAAPTSIRGRYVSQTSVSNGSIIATMKSSGISSRVAGKKIRLRLLADKTNGKYTWVCESNVDATVMPRDCVYKSFGAVLD